MWITSGTRRGRKTKYFWALICDDWGIHYLAPTKPEAQEEHRAIEANRKRGENPCGPHRLRKLEPDSSPRTKER